MLNPSVVEDSGKVPPRRSAFSHTCALLSQFMKEKEAMGNRSFELASNVDGRGSNNSFRRTTMNLFPQDAGFAPLKPNSSELKSAPMTIFYAGQVIVFNDFPANKAKEIMELASRGISQTPNTINDDDNENSNHPVKKSVVDSVTLTPPNYLNGSPASFGNNHQMQDPAQQPSPPINDLPIARKASLHRFLEKRKDRITAKAPYCTTKPGDMASKPKDGNPWLGLAAARAGLPSPQP